MSVNIHIEHLQKKFQDVEALKDINLHIDKNSLSGVIGPDGSGKTTLFRILTSLLLPDAGQVSIDGIDAVKEYKKLRQIVGYMPGRFSLYMDLTVEENLAFYAGIFKTSIQQNYDLIEDIYKQIEPFKKRRAGDLSGGMKQKLALSCALIHKPQLLILDEPTTGVDAVSRKEFWDLLKKMQQKGITILVSTPYMDEAALCDKVALMQTGKLLSVDTPEQIVRNFPSRLVSIKASNMYTLLHDLENFEAAESVYRFGDSIHLTSKISEQNIEEKLKPYLTEKGYHKIVIEPKQPLIEDCFLALMENPLAS
jgi:ABC-2 type transport system ATP-binding protein